MDSNHRTYDFVSSFLRIDDILALSPSNYEEAKELPDRDRLTYSNGFYAYCSALFVDIRQSSKLPICIAVPHWPSYTGLTSPRWLR